jgi:CheY-like chemotaxis protein
MGAEAGEGPAPPRPSVLVVDDLAANRHLAAVQLGAEGFDCALATGGEEALAAFALRRFDAVLLDLRMPGMDGLAAARRLRALPGAVGETVAVVGITAYIVPG